MARLTHMRKIERAVESGGHGGLNLTALVDILTNLLVFMILNFSVDQQNITVSNLLQPPLTTSVLKIKKEAPVVTISKNGILVDNTPVVKITGDWQLEGVDPNNPFLIHPLKEAMDKIYEKKEFLAKRGNFPIETEVIIIGDRDLPSRVLAGVIYSVGQSGFDKVQLYGISKKE